MDIWKILGINRTSDKSEVKKAYRAKLKITHPEDNPQEFMQLREAYENALQYVEQALEDEKLLEDEAPDYEGFDYEDSDYVDEEDLGEEDDENYVSVDSKAVKEWNINRKVSQWWSRTSQVLCDYRRRNDINEWKNLLYNDIPYQVVYFEKCRERMKGYMFDQDTLTCYLKEDVTRLIDGFFSFSPSQLDISVFAKRVLYNRMRQHEYIDFEGFIQKGNLSIDHFFKTCNEWAAIKTYWLATANVKDGFVVRKLDIGYDEASEEYCKSRTKMLESQIKKMNALYLPLECSILFDELENEDNGMEGVLEKIQLLVAQFGERDDLRLLQTAVMLHKGDVAKARRVLEELYLRAPLKNVMYLLRLSIFCQRAGMLFQSYMLTKQITWLTDESAIEKRANELYRIMEEEYCRKTEEGIPVSDEDKIYMCRMYLRSNREKDAAKILSEVTVQGRTTWHYYIADCLVLFNEDKVSPEIPSYDALKQYDKSGLSTVEQLEWEEMKVRYIFEQKRYEECIEECNKWIDRYPMSLVMLTIRGYADFILNDYYKKYMDIEALVYIYPLRAELRLALAEYQCGWRYYGDAVKVLEPIKDKYDALYQYAEIRNDGLCDDSDERKKKWIKLLSEIKKHGTHVPPYSKYAMLGLHDIYCAVSQSLWNEYDTKIFNKTLRLLDELIENMPNSPKKDEARALFYYNSNQINNTIEAALKGIETCEEEQTLIWYYTLFIDKYVAKGEYDKADEVAQKLCAIDKDGYRKVFNAYSWRLAEYDEALISRLEKMAEQYAANWRELGDCDMITRFYENVGILSNDKSKFLKGIEILEQFPQTFGYIGDNGRSSYNIYMKIAKLYALCGMEKEALGAIDKMYKYALKPENPLRFLHLIAEVYEYLEQFDKAVEYYEKAKEHGIYNNMRDVRMFLKIGDYAKAREIYMENSEMDAINEVEVLHTYYMEHGCYDRDELLKAKELLEQDIVKYKKDKNSDDKVGEAYLMLGDLCYALGEEKQSVQYKKKAEAFQWNNLQTKYAAILRTELWILRYQQKYREALELIDNNRQALLYREVEIDMFDYKLRKMDVCCL